MLKKNPGRFSVCFDLVNYSKDMPLLNVRSEITVHSRTISLFRKMSDMCFCDKFEQGFGQEL